MKKKYLFRVVFLVFLAAVILMLIDMASRTSAPWNKNKQIERVVNP